MVPVHLVQVEDASDLSDLELIQHMNMDLSRLTKLNGEYLLLDFPISLSLSLYGISCCLKLSTKEFQNEALNTLPTWKLNPNTSGCLKKTKALDIQANFLSFTVMLIQLFVKISIYQLKNGFVDVHNDRKSMVSEKSRFANVL